MKITTYLIIVPINWPSKISTLSANKHFETK